MNDLMKIFQNLKTTKSGNEETPSFLEFVDSMKEDALDALGEDVKQIASALDSLYPQAFNGHPWAAEELITEDKLQDPEARSALALLYCFGCLSMIAELQKSSTPAPTPVPSMGFSKPFPAEIIAKDLLENNIPITWIPDSGSYSSVEEGAGVIEMSLFLDELRLYSPKIYYLPVEGNSDTPSEDSTHFDFIERDWAHWNSSAVTKWTEKNQYDFYSYLPKEEDFYLSLLVILPSEIGESDDEFHFNRQETSSHIMKYSEETGLWTGKYNISSSISLIASIDPKSKRIDIDVDFSSITDAASVAAEPKIGIFVDSLRALSTTGFPVVGADFERTLDFLGTDSRSGTISSVSTTIYLRPSNGYVFHGFSPNAGSINGERPRTISLSQIKWFENPYADERQ